MFKAHSAGLAATALAAALARSLVTRCLHSLSQRSGISDTLPEPSSI